MLNFIGYLMLMSCFSCGVQAVKQESAVMRVMSFVLGAGYGYLAAQIFGGHVCS